MKAYIVHDGQEDTVVVFATSGVAARRLGADLMGIDFDEVESCRRSSEFDRFSPGPVPPLALIGAGWWQECYGCGCTIDENSEVYGIDDNLRIIHPVEYGQALYCTNDCLQHDLSRTCRQDDAEDCSLAVTRNRVHTKYPRSKLTNNFHVCAREDDNGKMEISGHVGFHFPGSLCGGAQMEIPSGAVSVRDGDLDAWRQYVSSR